MYVVLDSLHCLPDFQQTISAFFIKDKLKAPVSEVQLAHDTNHFKIRLRNIKSRVSHKCQKPINGKLFFVPCIDIKEWLCRVYCPSWRTIHTHTHILSQNISMRANNSEESNSKSNATKIWLTSKCWLSALRGRMVKWWQWPYILNSHHISIWNC